MLQIKRVYEDPEESDGYRVLTERLWPRGVTKERAKLDQWMKGVAPSDDLRKWFNHEINKWDEFRDRYRKELFGNKYVEELLELIKEHESITLVYASKDEEHNSTVILKEMLEKLFKD